MISDAIGNGVVGKNGVREQRSHPHIGATDADAAIETVKMIAARPIQRDVLIAGNGRERGG